MSEDVALELARMTREAIERVRNKMVAQQLGTAFVAERQQPRKAS